MPVYLGPYNDPLDANGTHHWDNPHAPDWRNAAISVSRSGGTFSIDVAVQNADVAASLGNTITLYGSFRTRSFADSDAVEGYVTRSIFGAAVPPVLTPAPWLGQTIPGRTSLGDRPWRPPTGTVLWTPSSPPSNAKFVIVLTVQAVTPDNSTRNSLVAVWVGP